MKIFKCKVGQELIDEWMYWEEGSFEDNDNHEYHVYSILSQRLFRESPVVMTERDVPTLITSLEYWIGTSCFGGHDKGDSLRQSRIHRSGKAFLRKLKQIETPYKDFAYFKENGNFGI